MKNIVLILFVLMTVSSCKVWIDGLQKEEFGSISVEVDNVPTVEMVTKADAVSADDFNVYISSETENYEYIYKDMPTFLTVPAGMYTVKAENVDEEASLTRPDQWGQVRYAGSSETKEVKAANVTNFSFTCRVVNTAVSVIFDSSIADHFTDYYVAVYNTEARQLIYNSLNTAPEVSATGYFLPGTISYMFSGTFMGEETPHTTYGTLDDVAAATHQHLTFRVAEQDGTVGKPEITVDTSIEDFYQSITVDPTEDGNYKTE